MIETTDEQMWEALQKSCDDQVKLLEKAKSFKPKKFESNTNNMIKLLEDYIDNTNHVSWLNKIFRFKK